MGYSLGLLPGPHDPSTQRLPRHVTSLAAISHSAKPSVQLPATALYPFFHNRPRIGTGPSIPNEHKSSVTHHYRRTVSTVRARVEASAAILFSFAEAFRVSAGAPVFRCSATSCSNRLISL